MLPGATTYPGPDALPGAAEPPDPGEDRDVDFRLGPLRTRPLALTPLRRR